MRRALRWTSFIEEHEACDPQRAHRHRNRASDVQSRKHGTPSRRRQTEALRDQVARGNQPVILSPEDTASVTTIPEVEPAAQLMDMAMVEDEQVRRPWSL